MSMTLDQAMAHLEGMRNRWQMAASDSRKRGEEYKAAANASDDTDLRRVHFEESSRFFGYAREIDQDVTSIDMVLAAIVTRAKELA